MDLNLFAGRLRTFRSHAMLTQAELAARVGVNWRVVQRWEHGRATPRQTNQRKLCMIFNRSFDDLFGPDA